MRRAVARGRVFPQSYSTDRRYGRLSLQACALFPLMWANADDQGRLSGEPEEVKYACCPNIDHISKADIPALLEELNKNNLVKVYTTSKTQATQMLDWWEVQRLQWAYPSEYPPPEGWTDHLRFHATPKEIVTENWPPPGRLPSELPNTPASVLPNALPSKLKKSPLTTPSEKEKRRGRGNLPSAPGSRSPPSPTASAQEILKRLTECFKREWGRVPADNLKRVIPREPGARESAQLRDLAKELSAAGGCPLDYIDQAFGEAAGQQKMHISYVRAILLDWLGVARGPPQ